MLDLSFLGIPILSALLLFGFAVATDIDAIHVHVHNVPPSMSAYGYDPETVEGALLQELYEISKTARTAKGERFTAIANFEAKAILAVGNELGIAKAVSLTQQVLGLTPYALDGEITLDGKMLVWEAKGHSAHGKLFSVTVTAPADDKHKLIRQMAETITDRIDPYLLAVYYFRKEFKPYAEGDVAAQKGFPKSLPQIRRCLQVMPAPTRHWPLLLLGRMSGAFGDQDQAIEFFKASADLDPKFMFAQARWGEALGKQGKTTEAIDKFEKAIELDPSSPIPWIEWAKMLQRQGDMEGARRCLEGALEAAPQSDYAHYELGRFYAAIGDYNAADQQLRRAISLYPDEPSYLQAMSEVVDKLFPTVTDPQATAPGQG